MARVAFARGTPEFLAEKPKKTEKVVQKEDGLERDGSW